MASTQALIDAVTTALPSPPLPPHVDRKDDTPEFELPPRKRLCLSALGSRYEMGESSTARPTAKYPVTVAVSDVHGAETRVHIPTHGGFEAQNGLPDSIPSNEPKPLVQHMPPPP
nr:hypothetical protein [Tanacetum cinerariifolium]